VTEDYGQKLLQAVEALMTEVRGLRSELGERRQNDVKHEQQRVKAVARQKRYIAKKKAIDDVKATSPAQVVSISSQEPEKQKQLTPPPDVKLTSPTEHQRLIDHGVRVIESAIGRKYPFAGGRDARHAKDLLAQFGIAEAQRAFDLAAQRFRGEPFWRSKGLTFGIVVQGAQALLTTGPAHASGAAQLRVDNEQLRAQPAGRRML
jgi:hypothetical protein